MACLTTREKIHPHVPSLLSRSSPSPSSLVLTTSPPSPSLSRPPPPPPPPPYSSPNPGGNRSLSPSPTLIPSPTGTRSAAVLRRPATRPSERRTRGSRASSSTRSETRTPPLPRGPEPSSAGPILSPARGPPSVPRTPPATRW
ncbi:hypothetical protein V2J09_009786 [Rumex salicifolius]